MSRSKNLESREHMVLLKLSLLVTVANLTLKVVNVSVLKSARA